VKVIGYAGEMFIPTVLSILEGVVGSIGKEAVVSRLSREGKYLSVTVTITAESRDQLESVYREVRKHRDVVFVL
jgi:putative lipoic acid-binding regulatory protein